MKYFFCFFMTMLTAVLSAQKHADSSFIHMEKRLSLITGYSYSSYHYGELGVGIKHDGMVGNHSHTIVYGFSNEFNFGASGRTIWGPKLLLWSGGGAAGLNIGLNVICYTDFNESSLRFRPEAGVGFGFFRLVYGYNLAITDSSFEGINKHVFTVNIIPDIGRLKKKK